MPSNDFGPEDDRVRSDYTERKYRGSSDFVGDPLPSHEASRLPAKAPSFQFGVEHLDKVAGEDDLWAAPNQDWMNVKQPSQDFAEDDETAGQVETCACGGQGMFMGVLGNTEWFRCQQCGMTFQADGSGLTEVAHRKRAKQDYLTFGSQEEAESFRSGCGIEGYAATPDRTNPAQWTPEGSDGQPFMRSQLSDYNGPKETPSSPMNDTYMASRKQATARPLRAGDVVRWADAVEGQNDMDETYRVESDEEKGRVDIRAVGYDDSLGSFTPINTANAADLELVSGSWLLSSKRKRAWTEDGSDITPGADQVMNAVDALDSGEYEADKWEEQVRERGKATTPEALVEVLRSVAPQVTPEDMRCLEDYNYHSAVQALLTLRPELYQVTWGARGASRKQANPYQGRRDDAGEQVTPTSVIFRKWRDDGSVIAIFPDLNEQSGDANPGMVMMYEHVGQHGEGGMGLIDETDPATPEEYAPLKQELESIGYVFSDVRTSGRKVAMDGVDWDMGGSPSGTMPAKVQPGEATDVGNIFEDDTEQPEQPQAQPKEAAQWRAQVGDSVPYENEAGEQRNGTVIEVVKGSHYVVRDDETRETTWVVPPKLHWTTDIDYSGEHDKQASYGRRKHAVKVPLNGDQATCPICGQVNTFEPDIGWHGEAVWGKDGKCEHYEYVTSDPRTRGWVVEFTDWDAGTPDGGTQAARRVMAGEEERYSCPYCGEDTVVEFESGDLGTSNMNVIMNCPHFEDVYQGEPSWNNAPDYESDAASRSNPSSFTLWPVPTGATKTARTFEECDPGFQRQLDLLAQSYGQSVEDVWAQWQEYARSSDTFGQSATFPEFQRLYFTEKREAGAFGPDNPGVYDSPDDYTEDDDEDDWPRDEEGADDSAFYGPSDADPGL